MTPTVTRVTLATNKKQWGKLRPFDRRIVFASEPKARKQRRGDRLWPPTINRFHPDWFALRLWEDDGGGQAVPIDAEHPEE